MIKEFEGSVPFLNYSSPDNPDYWLPIVDTIFVIPGGKEVQLRLLFDTGADCITVDRSLYSALGLRSWKIGGRKGISSGSGGKAKYYTHAFTIELFGKTICGCPIDLQKMKHSDDLFDGLLGRDIIFKHFGFGFWERTRELYYTLHP